jgi:hypothetical protein
LAACLVQTSTTKTIVYLTNKIGAAQGVDRILPKILIFVPQIFEKLLHKKMDIAV